MRLCAVHSLHQDHCHIQFSKSTNIRTLLKYQVFRLVFVEFSPKCILSEILVSPPLHVIVHLYVRMYAASEMCFQLIAF